MGVLGIEPRSFSRAARALNHRTISLTRLPLLLTLLFLPQAQRLLSESDLSLHLSAVLST